MKKKPVDTPAGRRRPSIRFYLITRNLVMLGILFPLVGYFFLLQVDDFRQEQMERITKQLHTSQKNRAASMARNLALNAGQALAGYDFSFLNTMLSELVEHDDEIVYAIAMNSSQKALAHNNLDKLGTILQDPLAERAAAILAASSKPSPETVAFFEATLPYNNQTIPILEVAIPIYSGEVLAGVLRCGYSQSTLLARIERTKGGWATTMSRFRYSFMSFITLMFVIGSIVALIFNRLFSRATAELSQGIARISKGERDVHIDISSMFCAEFLQYANGFNEMTRELSENYTALEESSKSLAIQVKMRTRALEEAQKELLRQAHEAGMAEMAVGVLHNIGNAITPAKVGVTLLLRRMKSSPLRKNLDTITTELIEELNTPGSLPDERKKYLAKIITLLPSGIREESDHIIAEIERVRDKHEHIEGVISLQMRYAQLIGSKEEIDINVVIDDALRILQESILNRHIRVIKNFSSLPRIQFEQARLIQIIINLIKNSLEALEESSERSKRLIITTWLEDTPEKRVLFSIWDNGCGFSPDMKEQLFQFGFTTKKKGSGFGLHSCANYLLANNGTITAKSEGKDKGAEFTVSLAAATHIGEGDVQQ